MCTLMPAGRPGRQRPTLASEDLLLAGESRLGLACLCVEGRADASGEPRKALDRCRGVLRRDVAGAQGVGRVLELGNELLEFGCHCGVTSVRLTAPRMPLMKPGASAAHSSLAASTASSMATSSGTSVR